MSEALPALTGALDLPTPDQNGNIPVPARPGMKVRGMLRDGQCVTLWYTGSREDILSLGIISSDALEIWRPGKPKGRKDKDGDKIWVSRHFSVRAGEPHLRFIVALRHKRMDQVQHLAGARDAISIARIEHAKFVEERKRWDSVGREASSGNLEQLGGPGSASGRVGWLH